MGKCNTSTIDALVEAMSQNNEAAMQMIVSQNMPNATQALTKVLRTCQQIIGSFEDEGMKGVQSSSSKVVQELLELCMKKQQMNVDDSSRFATATYPHDTLRNRTDRTSSSSFPVKDARERMTLPQRENEYQGGVDRKEHSYVYGKPIRIPSNFDHQLITKYGFPNICMLLSCAATFNLALLHQLAAQEKSTEERCNRSTMLFAKAARLYEICVSLQTEEIQDPIQDFSFFYLATTNNLGLALEQLGEEDKVQKCFSFALSALMCLISQANIPGREEIFDPRNLPCSADFDGFFLNALRIMFHAKPAPAA